MNKKILKFRDDIDEIDSKIIELLNLRMKLALKIGEVKKCENLKIYDANRENDVIANIQKNRGRLPEEAVEQIFKDIISCCRNAELIDNE